MSQQNPFLDDNQHIIHDSQRKQQLAGMFFADEKDDGEKQADNDSDNGQSVPPRPWRILIVDDEPQVHQITKLILSRAEFNQRPMEFISAYSGQEALQVLKSEEDIAVILLDVVMESNHAGLETVKAIRQELNNQMVRIILRTGQPGEAPDSQIILDYDINDYKEKSELTYNKLFTSVVASLRTYQQLCHIKRCQEGLKKIIHATIDYCQIKSEEEFAGQVLQQISQLLNLGDDSLYFSGHTKNQSNNGAFSLLAGSGKFAHLSTQSIQSDPTYLHLQNVIQKAFDQQQAQTSGLYFAYYFSSPNIGEHVIVMENQQQLAAEERHVLELFINSNLSAYSNLMGEK